MFGQTGGFGSTSGGFGQQPQQGQQQAGGLFGQTSTGFGQPQQQTGGMFGQTQQPGQTGGLFGQPAQPAQQQSTGLFGGAASGQTNAFGSTGGAFGSGSTGTFGQQQQARPAFGAAGTGGGLFGGAANGGSTFGGSTGFGATNTAAPATGGGLFGSTSTGFGAKPATTGFGASATTAGNTGGLFGAKPAGTGLFGAAAPASMPGPVTNGTASTAYQPVKEKDGNTNNYTVYQTITCMDPYKGASLEELRLQDYQQNRKTAPPPGTNPFGAGSSTGGMFGQPAQQQSTGLFGQSAAQPAATGFGAGASTGLFGQAAQPAGTTAFGQPQQSTGFGAPSTGTGLFGSNTQSTGTGLFGQQPQQQQQQQTGGLFGQQSQQSGGLFGQSGTTGTTGGLFGSNTGTATTGGGLFGQQQAQPAASGAFSFGATNNQNQAKPAFGGFGTGSTTTSTFGQPAAAGTSTGFGFGQNNQQAQQPQAAQQSSTGFGFGAQSNTAAPQAGGLFGSQPQQQNQQSGGLFGSKPVGGLFSNPSGSSFGAPAQSQSQTGGGLFGAAAQPAQPAGQQASTGLFGSTGTNTFGAAKPGGLFGQPAQTGTTGGGLFGNNSTSGTTGFGQPAAQPSTGLFGSTGQQTGGGLFGNLGASQQGQQNQTGQTGGLFGVKPNNAGSGLFGQSGTTSSLGASTGGSGLFGSSFGAGAQQQTNQNLGGSLFGNSSTNQLQQSQPQPPVNIDVNNPYGTSGMFSVPPSFQPINVSTGPKVLPPLSSSLRPAPSAGKMTPRFRGISTPARAASTLPQSSILGVSTASNGSPARNLFSTPPSDTLSPAAFTPRQGVKKLVLQRKTDPLSLSSTVANRTPQISRSILNPEADHEGTSVNGSVMGNTAAGSRQASVARTQHDDAATEKDHRRAEFSRKIDLDDYQHGDYYTIPELSELYNASNEDLSSVEDFVVGRKGYGRLTFLEPVDLGNKHTLSQICGELVIFKDGKCEVYPEGSDARPPGEGLNHRAEISLEDCWPRNKETQQPITDAKHPKQRARERALRHVPDTTFQSYNPSTGVWVFTVEHFTLYGIPEEDDSDDEEDDMDAQEESVLNHNGKRERSTSTESERLGSIRDDSTAGSLSEIDGSSVASDDEGSDYGRSSVQPVEIAVRQRDLIFTGMYGTLQAADLDLTPRPNKKRLQFFRKAEKDLDGEVDGGDVDQSFFGATRTAPSKEREEWKMRRIETNNSVTQGEEGAFLDAGLALGRSQRATLASTGHVFRSRQYQVVSWPPPRGKDMVDEREIMTKLLEFQLHHSNFIDEKGVPIAETDTKVRFKDFADLFRGDARYEAELWRLGRALFDEIPTLANAEVPGQIRVDAESLVRKTAVSDWLTSYLSPIVDREATSKDSGPQTVFTLLIANQVGRATTIALEGGDLRLATLVAQAGSGPEFQNTMGRQLEIWRKQDVDAHIDVAYRRVYALLAGIVDVVEGGSSADTVDMSQGLSWLQALGMHLWFGTPLEQPLPDVITNYQAHLESDHPPARPLVANTETEDAMFSLFKVFMEQSTPAACLAGSATYGKDTLNVRLQWHLLDLLVNVFGFGTSEEHVLESVRTFDRLSVDYASQLEQEGMWEYAVFVLLHLDKANSRLSAIKNMIGRHVTELADKEDILQQMRLPKEWLAEARANLCASEGDVYQEFLFCKQAGLMDRAHAIVLYRLAPEVVLREDTRLLRKLLADLQDAKVIDWHKGGQVLLQYSDLCDRTKDLLNASISASDELTEIVQRIPALLESLERIYACDRSIDIQQLACRTHMLAKVQKVATAFASQRLMHMPPLSRLLPEGDRLQVMQSASRDRLQRRLEALTA